MTPDLDELVRRSDPLRGRQVPTLPASLLDDIIDGHAKDGRTPGPRVPSRARRFGWPAAVTVALAAALLAVAALAPAARAPHGQPRPPSQARVRSLTPAAFFRQLAGTAAARPDATSVISTWQTWSPARLPDGPLVALREGRMTAVVRRTGGASGVLDPEGAVTFFSPQARGAWEAAGRPPLQAGDYLDDPPARLVSPQVAALLYQFDLFHDPMQPLYYRGAPGRPPRLDTSMQQALRQVHDAADLRPLLEAWQQLNPGLDARGSAWRFVIRLLLPGHPPGLRAAAFELLGELDGIQVEPAAQDLLGRPGVAFWLSDSSLQHRFVVDPRTSELLSYDESLEHTEPWAVAPVGTRVAAMALLSSKPRR